MSKKKPPKVENLLELVKKCINEDKYTLTPHATIRHNERKISLVEILHILKTGYEEKKKTYFDDNHNAWKYAIRGKTKIDSLDVRIIVAFDEFQMLIITVMFVGGV